MNYSLYEQGSLVDLIDVQMGYAFKGNRFSDFGVPVIKIKNLTGRLVDTVNVMHYPFDLCHGLERFNIEDESILVAMTGAGSVGRVSKIKTNGGRFLLNQRVGAIKVKDSKKLNNEYLYQVLCTDIYQSILYNSAVGSGQPNLNADQIKSVEIPLPPIAIQEKIASILKSIDDKILLNYKMNEHLEHMVITLNDYWFEDYNGSTTQVKLTDIIEINPRESVKNTKKYKRLNMQALPIDSMSVVDSDINFNDSTSGSRFVNGDTLLARITPCLENGKTAFVNFLDNNEIGIGSTEFIVLRAKQPISPQFVYCLARNPKFREYAIKSMVGTSGRQRVQSSALLNFELNKPNKDFMNKFHLITKEWFRQIRCNIKEVISLTQTRETLLHRFLSGEIELTEKQSEEVS